MIPRLHYRCPIHGEFTCCGREDSRKKTGTRKRIQIGPGITKILDEHHPRGYRIHRSKSAMRDLLEKKVMEQKGQCFWCQKAFTDFREVQADHREPKGMGSARRDDHEDNIVASCGSCNHDKGSRRDYVPRADRVA